MYIGRDPRELSHTLYIQQKLLILMVICVQNSPVFSQAVLHPCRLAVMLGNFHARFIFNKTSYTNGGDLCPKFTRIQSGCITSM